MGQGAELLMSDAAARFYQERGPLKLPLYSEPGRSLTGYRIQSLDMDGSIWVVRVHVEAISDTREDVCEELRVGTDPGSSQPLVLAARTCSPGE